MALPSPPRLHLYLLGSFRLERQAQPIRISTRKTESLLAYLVLHPGPHPREKLVSVFWGDTPEEKARGSFRTALNLLRRQVGEEVLLADRDTVQLNPACPIQVDALEFKSQAAAFLAASAPDPDRLSLELYQGDLLADFYDDWIETEREGLRRLYLEALLRLIQLMRSQSRYERAIALAQAVLRHDPGSEPAHQHLIFCYLAAGDRKAALQQFEACRQILRDEFGLEPMPETLALYQWITQTPAPGPSEAALLTNLPVPLTSFVGRTHEMAQVKQWLLPHDDGPRARLLTLTGPGGCGKTRLAIQVGTDLVAAGAFKDGVWWVELAALHDGGLVAQAVANALNVREAPARSLNEVLIDHLRARQLLLVLDNCEYLTAACARLAQTLLSACPRLQILTTSREVLGLLGEFALPVPPLSLPDPKQVPPVSTLTRWEAIRLFVERASAVNPRFALVETNAAPVVQICSRLDGIPLAIELAAVWLRMLSAAQVAARLDDRFALLAIETQSGLARHQTLQAAIDWSYDILPDEERRLFSQLSVFAGGFTLEAVEAVARRDEGVVLGLLSRLVDKSFVVVDEYEGAARYHLLETIRYYAREKLAGFGEAEGARDRHLAFFTALVEQAEVRLIGPDQMAWLGYLEREYANVREALEWAVQDRREGSAWVIDSGLRLAGALLRFWSMRGYWSEGRAWLSGLLGRPLPASSPKTIVRAKALNAAGYLAWFQNDYAAGQAYYEESLAVGRQIDARQEVAFALRGLGLIAYTQNDYAPARRLFEESLDSFRALGDLRGVTQALDGLGELARREGDYERAALLYEENLALRRSLGGKQGIAVSLHNLGHVALHQGSPERAEALFREGLGLCLALKIPRVTVECLAGMAGVAAGQGRPLRAAQLFGAVEALLDSLGIRLDPSDRVEYDRNVASARAQADAPGFDEAWARGRAMTLEEAGAYALENGA